MTTFTYILGITAALVVVINVLGEYFESIKRWRRSLTLIIAVVGLVLAVFAFPSGPPVTKEDMLTARDSIVSTIQCEMESLKMAILKGDTVTAREQAECIDANLILQTAMDSGVVQLGLGNYERAIIHLNYAIQGAPDDSTKAKALFYRVLLCAILVSMRTRLPAMTAP